MKKQTTFRLIAVLAMAVFFLVLAAPAQCTERAEGPQHSALTITPWSILHLSMYPGIAHSPLSGLLFSWWGSYSTKAVNAVDSSWQLGDPPRYCGGEDGFIAFGVNGP